MAVAVALGSALHTPLALEVDTREVAVDPLALHFVVPPKMSNPSPLAHHIQCRLAMAAKDIEMLYRSRQKMGTEIFAIVSRRDLSHNESR